MPDRIKPIGGKPPEKPEPPKQPESAPVPRATPPSSRFSLEEEPKRRVPPGMRFALWLLVGIAVMSVAGYLVAAVWLFPAPLLPTERVVSRVGGMFEDRARRELERVGLGAEVTAREPDPLAAAGTVIWQDPPPGVAVPRGTAVSLVLSSGVPKVMVPDIRGYDPDFAQRLLAAVGLRVDGIDTLDIKGVPPGAAGSTDPVAGDSVLIGRSIFLHLAR
jgi:serine/threonine-protein kinase